MAKRTDRAAAVLRRVYRGWRFELRAESHLSFARRILLPGGPLTGAPYDPASDPIQHWLLEQFDSGRWRSMSWLAPPQIAGKTLVCIVIPALRAAIAAKQSVGYGLPTLHDLDRGWTTKLAPMFRAAGFGAYLPSRGPGSRGGRPLAVSLVDPASSAELGSIVFLAGGARQVSCQVVVLDEVDAWRDWKTNEPRWQDVFDCWARADSFGELALRVATSTLETDDPARSIIWQLAVERGTGTRWWHRCARCSRYAPAEWSDLVFEYTSTDGPPDLAKARETARLVCPHCQHPRTDAEWRDGIRAGAAAHRWQRVDEGGRVVDSEAAPSACHDLGLRTTALDCVLTSLPAIAEACARARYALEARGDHEPSRKLWRYLRCEPYRGDQHDEGGADQQELTAEALAKRSREAWAEAVHVADDAGTYSRHLVSALPDGADYVVAAIDVQHSRCYTAALAWSVERRTAWAVAWSIEYGPGGGEELRALSDQELHGVLTGAADWLESIGSAALPMRQGVIDVSDSTRMAVLEEWLRSRAGRWRAVQGEPRLPRGATIERRGPYAAWDRRWRPGLGSWRIVTEQAQRAVHRALCIAPTEDGTFILPRVRPSVGFVRHLVAVGEYRGRWQKLPGAGRHDWLDAVGYAYAIAPYVGGGGGSSSDSPGAAPAAPLLDSLANLLG